MTINEVYKLIDKLIQNALEQNDMGTVADLATIGSAVKTLEEIIANKETSLIYAKGIISALKFLKLEVQNEED